MSLMLTRTVFGLAAVYDGVLGLLFLVAAPWAFEVGGLPVPGHFGYIHFAAALLVVFAILFAQVAAAPVRSRMLIPYGVLLKLSYCGVVMFHAVTDGVSWIWIVFGVADLAFLVLFVMAWWSLGRKPTTAPA